MADDRRLDQIKEGAGLEESRINQDLVEFLRKWSTPVLMVLALIMLGYFFYNKQKAARQAHVDEAFREYNQSAEIANPSPDALKGVAEDFKDVEGVYLLATQRAADEYLRAVQRGVKPGAELDQAGEPVDPSDMLTDEDRERFLKEAESLYRKVYDRTTGKPQLSLHTLAALYGLAAVSESRNDAQAARNVLDQALALAKDHGYLEHITILQDRIDKLPSLVSEEVKLYAKADLPEIPALAQPEPELPTIDENTDVTAPQDAQTGPMGPTLPDEGEGASQTDQGADDGAGASNDADQSDKAVDDNGSL